MTFAVVYRGGPAWQAGVAFREQPGVGRHADFLAAQFAAGRLRLGGPFLDDSGGFCLYEADTAAELEAVLATDEAIGAGLLIYELHPTMVVFDASATETAR